VAAAAAASHSAAAAAAAAATGVSGDEVRFECVIDADLSAHVCECECECTCVDARTNAPPPRVATTAAMLHPCVVLACLPQLLGRTVNGGLPFDVVVGKCSCDASAFFMFFV
jgi:hypothetical protein